MPDTLQPPTDNLYKFFAVGGLACVLLMLYFLFSEQARDRADWVATQVELKAAGYQENTGEPHDPELRKAYFRREYAKAEGADLTHLLTGSLGKVLGWSVAVSLTGFALWGWRVQWHEDAILRLTAAKMKREELAAPVGGGRE